MNVKNTEKMKQKQSFILSPNVIEGKRVNIVEDFKYLGSHVGLTEHDVEVRWAEFVKVKSILRSPKVKLSTSVYLKQQVSRN